MNMKKKREGHLWPVRPWRRTAWLLCLVVVTGYVREAPAEEASAQVPVLIHQLQTGAESDRVNAADQLAHLGEAARPAVPVLFGAINGQSSWVDIALSEALNELGPVSLPFLLDKFQNGEPEIRIRALRGMSNMGAGLREARPLFQKALEDKNENIRQQAVRILQNMDAALAAQTNAVSTQKAGPPPVIGLTRPPKTAADRSVGWPGFRGPDRDGICAETGLLREWPVAGPKLLWRLDTLGNGISAISIAGGKLFMTGDRQVDGGKAQYVIAFDMATRAELWATRVGNAYAEYGALSTPTLDGERLYVTTTDGSLCCLKTVTGAMEWQKNLAKDFGGMMMSRWKWSETPLVDGEKVNGTPGGSNAKMVALNKLTGEMIWQCAAPSLGERGKDGAGYCSAVVAEIDGVRQYLQVVGRGLIGVAADSGKFLWGYNRLASTVANIPGPIVRGRDVFTANGYNTGSALVRLQRQRDGFRVEEVYVLPHGMFQNHHGGFVLAGDYIYGGSGSNKGDPTCIEFASGRVMWSVRAPAPGSACVLYADGHVIFRYDRGLTVLVEANPTAFRVKSSFTPPRSNWAAWSYPVIHEGRLYLRDQNLLLCYDLRWPAEARKRD